MKSPRRSRIVRKRCEGSAQQKGRQDRWDEFAPSITDLNWEGVAHGGERIANGGLRILQHGIPEMGSIGMVREWVNGERSYAEHSVRAGSARQRHKPRRRRCKMDVGYVRGVGGVGGGTGKGREGKGVKERVGGTSEVRILGEGTIGSWVRSIKNSSGPLSS